MYGTRISLLSNKKEPLLLNYIYEQVAHQYDLPSLSLIRHNANRKPMPWPTGKYRVAYIAPLSYDGYDEFIIRFKPGNETAEESTISLSLQNGSEEIRALSFDFAFKSAKHTFSQVITVIKEVSYRRKQEPEFICYGYKEAMTEGLTFITETRLHMLILNLKERRYMHKAYEVKGVEAFA